MRGCPPVSEEMRASGDGFNTRPRTRPIEICDRAAARSASRMKRRAGKPNPLDGRSAICRQTGPGSPEGSDACRAELLPMPSQGRRRGASGSFRCRQAELGEFGAHAHDGALELEADHRDGHALADEFPQLLNGFYRPGPIRRGIEVAHDSLP